MSTEKRSRWMLLPEQRVLLAVLLLILLLFYWIRSRSGLLPWQDMRGTPPVPLNSFVVEVEGDHVSSGIYTFPQPIGIDELLEKAGIRSTPILREGPPGPLETGTTITLSQNGQGLRIDLNPMNPAKKILYGIPVDLNEIAAEELMLIPGIGPTLAQRIVRYREDKGRFTRLDELRNVSGIGKKKFESLRRYLSVRRETAPTP